MGPDGKVLVRIARKGRAWRPLSVSISLHHHEESDWVFLNAFAEEAVETACAGRATPDIALDGADMFVCGDPDGDNGQTGKKLVMDAYGPSVPIGGGAWSGKDFWKVDRRGALLARDGAAPGRDARTRRSARDARVLPGERCAGARRGDRRWTTRGARLPCADGRRHGAKLQAIFTPSRSSPCEFDLKEATRWGHHAYFGELHRELPEFVASPKMTTSSIRRAGHSYELGVGHLADGAGTQERA